MMSNSKEECSYWNLRKLSHHKNPFFLRWLPHHLYPVVRLFLSERDYRSFLNTHNSPDQQEIRKMSIKYSLNEEYTNHFCESVLFRELLLSKVGCPARQLSLSFFFDPTKHRNIKDIEELFLSHVEVNSEHKERIQIFLFQELYGLTLMHFHRLTSIKGLKNLKHLSLCHISQLSDLSPLYYLSLEDIYILNCNEVVDVAALFQVPRVHISSCHKLSNISTLGNHKRLTIQSCPLISTIQSLANINFLRFIHCMNLRKFVSLKNIHSLHVQDCISVTDVSSFSGIAHISIQNCSFLRTVNPLLYPSSRLFPHLRSVTSLELISCPSAIVTPPLTLSFTNSAFTEMHQSEALSTSSTYYAYTLSPSTTSTSEEMSEKDDFTSVIHSNCPLNPNPYQVTSIEKIKVISPCHHIDFTLFSKVLKLELHSLNIQDVEPFSQIPFVILHLCYGIMDVGPLKNCSRLVLSHCPKVEDINMLGRIPHLTLIYCRNVTCIDLLGQISQNYVKIERCHRIKSFSSLVQVKELHLIDCQGFSNWNDVKKVEKLTVKYCLALEKIDGSTHLRSFTLSCCPNVYSIVGNFPKLEEFVISECEQLNPYIEELKKFLL